MALLGWLQERWSVRGHPRPYVPKNCFYKLHRGDDGAFGEAFYRCSYLAKVRGKGYGGSCANNYSGSRVGLKATFTTGDTNATVEPLYGRQTRSLERVTTAMFMS